MKVDFHFYLLSGDSFFGLLFKTPNLENEFSANTQEDLLFFNLCNIRDSFSVYAESSVNVRQVIDFDKNNSSFRKPYHQKFVKFLAIFSLDKLIVRVGWLNVLIEIWWNFTVVSWRFSRAIFDARDRLVHVLAFIIFKWLWFSQTFESSSLLVDFIDTNRTCFQEQKHSLNAHAIEHLDNLGRGWRRVYRALYTLVDWIKENDRIIFKPYKEWIRIVVVLVRHTQEAFAHGLDLLLRYVIRWCQVTNETDLYKAFEYHSIDFVID